MSATGVVGADIPSKQECTEREDVNILIFVNVVFSLLPNAKNVNNCNTAQNKCVNGAIADIVKEHPCFHSNVSIENNPDKIYAFESDIQCQDLYCDENGECIDPIGAYTKILSACSKVDDYLSDLVFPPESKIQVCLNVMGFEPISDITWGFAFMADACCPNNVEDEILNELIMDEYEPYFIDYIKKSWKVNVIYIGLMEYGVVFEMFNQQEKSKSSNQIDRSKNGTLNQVISDNGKPSKDTPKDDEPDSPIVLEGHVSQTRVNLSSFYSFDHILDCIPPLSVVRFIDRLTGVDKIENRMKENLNRSIMEYARGNSEEGWKHLKEAGAASLHYTHKRLELLAFVPGIGSIAGVADGYIYTIQEGIAYKYGEWEDGNKLKEQALWAYAGAIPFYKIVKYGKPVIKTGKVISEGSDKIIKERKRLALAQILYKKAAKAPKPKTKVTIREFHDSRKRLRVLKANLEKMRSNPEYQSALREYGIRYEDAISNYKVTYHEKIRVLDGKKTPLADVIQAAVFQVVNPYSSTRELVRNKNLSN